MQAAALDGVDMWPRAGETRPAYLPNETGARGTSLTASSSTEQVTRYQDRVRQSVLVPVWWDAVRRTSMAPLRETVTLNGWSSDIDKWALDLDGIGRSKEMILMEILGEQAVNGIHFVLVDLDTVPDETGPAGEPVTRSMGDDDRAGMRPFAVTLEAGDFDPLAIAKIKGETVLTGCAVYQEKTARKETEDGSLGEEKKSASWREYRLTGEGVEARDHVLKEADREAEVEEVLEWQPVRPLGTGKLDRILVTPFYGDFESGPFRGRPPYAAAAEMAASAWRKRSDRDALARQNALLRFFFNHTEIDDQGNTNLKMQMSAIYNTGEGSAEVLETSGNALKILGEGVAEDENAIRTAVRSIAAEKVTGAPITAMESGLRGLEAGTYQEVVTQGNARQFALLLQTFEIMGGLTASGGTVEWRYESVRMLSGSTLDRMKTLVETPGPDGEPLFPLSSYLHLERSAGNLPETFDIDKAIAGTLE